LSSHPDATVRSRVLGRMSASNDSSSVNNLSVLSDSLIDSGDPAGDISDSSVDHRSLRLRGGLATDSKNSEGGGQFSDSLVESVDSSSDNATHDVDGGVVVDRGLLVGDVVDHSSNVDNLSVNNSDSLSDNSDVLDDVNSGGVVLDSNQLVGEVNDLLSEHGGLVHEFLDNSSLDLNELPDLRGDASGGRPDISDSVDHSVDVGDLLAEEGDSTLQDLDLVDINSSLGTSRGGVDLVDENGELLEDSVDLLSVNSDSLSESLDDLSHDEGSARNERDSADDSLVDSDVASDHIDLSPDDSNLANNGRLLRLRSRFVSFGEFPDDNSEASDLLDVLSDDILGVTDEDMSLFVHRSTWASRSSGSSCGSGGRFILMATILNVISELIFYFIKFILGLWINNITTASF